MPPSPQFMKQLSFMMSLIGGYYSSTPKLRLGEDESLLNLLARFSANIQLRYS